MDSFYPTLDICYPGAWQIQCRDVIDRCWAVRYVRRRLPGVAHRDLEPFQPASLVSGVS